MLLLSALSVALDTILASYLESNHRNQRRFHGLSARLALLAISPNVAMPLLKVRAGYLQALLQTIEQEWGSTANFLSETLSVDEKCLQANNLEITLRGKRAERPQQPSAVVKKGPCVIGRLPASGYRRVDGRHMGRRLVEHHFRLVGFAIRLVIQSATHSFQIEVTGPLRHHHRGHAVAN